MVVYEISEPTKKISKNAITIWRITSTLTDLIGFIVVLTILWVSYYFDWPQWLVIMLWIFLIATPFLAIWSIVIRPRLLHKYWRYSIDEHYVRLRYGIFTRTDFVVPMTKIQYVEANQGPLLRKYELYSLTIGTMSSSHDIPALPKDEAFALRDQISHHAKLKEVE